MKKYQYLLTESKGPALWITLNRPTTKNAFNLEMGKELLDAMRAGIRDKQHAVIVLTGAGEAFSAGGDIKLMNQTPPKKHKDFFLEISRLVNSTVLEMQSSPKPVIAAIPGYVGGVAFGLCLGTDLRIAATEACFNAATIRIGLVANGGATYFLPRLIGLARAAEILFLGEVCSAQEALNMGLINKVVDSKALEQTVQSWAEHLANLPRSALGRVKELLNESSSNTLPRQLERERQSIAWSSTLPDFREGIEAFVQKRKGKFNQI